MKRVLLASLLGVTQMTAGHGAEVVLHRSNPAKVQARAVPVTVGVPFALGQLTDEKAVALVDVKGRPVPCQTAATSRWWSRDGSVQTLLVSFLADTSQEHYHLLYGRSATSTKPVGPKHRVKVSKQRAMVTVDNSLLRARINGQKVGFFEELAFDADRDGVYETNETVVSPTKPASLRMGEYSSLLAAAERLEVEEDGPIRAVVRVSGHHRSAAGSDALRYDMRLYFFAELPYIRIDHTFIQDTNEIFYDLPSVSLDLPLASSGGELTFGLMEGKAYSASVGRGDNLYLLQQGPDVWEYVKTCDVKWGSHYVPLRQVAPGQWEYEKGKGVPEFDQILQERLRWASQEEKEMWAKGPKANLLSAQVLDGGKVVSEGQRAAGWVRMKPQDRSWALTAGMRYLWQHHPKEIAWDKGTLRFCMYPEHIAKPLHLHTGTAKTHTLFLYFHRPADTGAAEAMTDASFEPPSYFAPPQWYCQSKVWGDVLERREGRFRLYEKEAETEIERFITQIERGAGHLLDRRPDSPVVIAESPGLFGMLNFGDYGGGMTGNNLETAFDHGLAYQFIRSGDRRVFDRFEQSVLHFRDVDVRQAVPGDRPFDYGMWLIPGYVPEALAKECAQDAQLRDKVFYWIGDQPPAVGGVYRHGFRHYGNGAEFPGAPMSSRPEARLRMYSGHCAVGGHGWAVGLVDHYLLTGDRRSLEIAELAGQWVLQHGGTGWGRDNWKYRDLARLYRATGRKEYLTRLMEAIDVIYNDKESTVERIREQDKTLMSPFYTILQFIAEVHRLTGDPQVRRKYLDLIDRWIDNVPSKESSLGPVFGYIRDYRDSRCHTDFADCAYAYLLTGDRKYVDKSLNTLDFYLHFAYHSTAFFSVPEYLYVLDKLGLTALGDPPRIFKGTQAFIMDKEDRPFNLVLTQEEGYRVAARETAGRIEVTTPSGKVIPKPVSMGGVDVHRIAIPADGEKGVYKVKAVAERVWFGFGADLPMQSFPPPSLVEGKFGKGVQLAEGAKLDLPAEGHLNLNEGTIELWFQPMWDAPSGRTQAVPYHYHQLFDSRDSEYDYGFVVYLYDGGEVGAGKSLMAAWADKDKSDGVSIGVQWKKGEFHHIAFAWKSAGDRTGQMRLYVDGKLVASKGDGTGFPTKLSPTIRLGMNSTDSPNTPANGVIDELRVSRVMRLPEMAGPLKADGETLLLRHFEDEGEQ